MTPKDINNRIKKSANNLTDFIVQIKKLHAQGGGVFFGLGPS